MTPYQTIIRASRPWWSIECRELLEYQEKTKKKLIESLKIGAKEMLETEIPFEPEALMITLNIPDPEWEITESSV